MRKGEVPSEVQPIASTADDYKVAARVATARQRTHAKSTVRWITGAVLTHVFFPHVAIANDIMIAGSLMRGGQTVADTVDRVTYESEAQRFDTTHKRL